MIKAHRWVRVSGDKFPRSWHRIFYDRVNGSFRATGALSYGFRLPYPPRALSVDELLIVARFRGLL